MFPLRFFGISCFYRTPLVSFLYERGWRQNFIWGGFPGPEKEVRRNHSLVLQRPLIYKEMPRIASCLSHIVYFT